ncbi:MAG: MFS transporter [Hyphomicrobiaceae bacterium]|nr:MFS transporter [Hyphomicrobiaceae bacterium]
MLQSTVRGERARGAATPVEALEQAGAAWARNATIALMAFLTVVDLFATQAILPGLVRHYGVTPAAMGVAVNASTLGMAVSGLLVSIFARRIDRRIGIVASLALLSVPTALLAAAPGLGTFTVLRVVQGLLMAAAFTLTLAHLGERCSAAAAAGAFAAYITGNVASNLVGRLFSAAIADHLGLAANFYVFALLNLAGAALAYATVHQVPTAPSAPAAAPSPANAWAAHLRNPPLRAGFGVGFCILFAFIGTFTFVNFVLTAAPISLGPMQLGLVYFVFLPSVLTTPLAGAAVTRWGTRPAIGLGLATAIAALPLLLSTRLPFVLAGMVLMGIGTFFAQAVATGFVSRAAATDRAAASGIYLAAYFAGGLIGTAVLGQVFDRLGWAACVAGVGLALAAASLLALGLRHPCPSPR